MYKNLLIDSIKA